MRSSYRYFEIPTAFDKIIVHEPVYYDDLIEHLLLPEHQCKSYKQISDAIAKGFGGMLYLTLELSEDLTDLYVYRITDYEPSQSEEHLLKHYSYNPNGKLNRANIEGYPVFYCSLTPETALTEMKGFQEDKYFMSKWKLKAGTGLHVVQFLVNVDENSDSISAIFARQLNKGIEEMTQNFSNEQKRWFKYKLRSFCNLFSIQNKENHTHYNITSAIAHHWMYDTGVEHVAPIIAYPSITNGLNDINLAVRPDIVDNPNQMVLEAILEMRLKKSEEENNPITNVRRKGQLRKGKIRWLNYERKLSGIYNGETRIWLEGSKQHVTADAKTTLVTVQNKEVSLQYLLVNHLWDYLDFGVKNYYNDHSESDLFKDDWEHTFQDSCKFSLGGMATIKWRDKRITDVEVLIKGKSFFE